MGWSQIVILLLFVGLPLLTRGLQSLNDKKNADRERKRREGRISEANADHGMVGVESPPSTSSSHQTAPAAMQLPGTRSAETSRREELARKRAGQLASWRARQAGVESGAIEAGVGGSSVIPGPGRVAASAVPSDLLSAQSGSQLLRSMLAETEERARRVQGGSKERTLAEHQRRQHAPGSKSEAAVHRLVPSDEEVEVNGGRVSSKKASRSSGVAEIRDRVVSVLKIARSPEALRRAFILKEVFDPPVALRQEQY